MFNQIELPPLMNVKETICFIVREMIKVTQSHKVALTVGYMAILCEENKVMDYAMPEIIPRLANWSFVIDIEAIEGKLYLLTVNEVNNEKINLIKKYCQQLILNAQSFEITKECSIVDELTGLPNKRAMYKRIADEIAKGDRYGNRFGLIFLDLDNFKYVNDNYGHLFGDNYLREFAAVLRDSLRKVDMVSRFGGDEFVILISNVDPDLGDSVLSRLIKELSRIKLKGITVSASVGMAFYPDDGLLYDDLMKMADRRMYKCKERKKERKAI